MPPIISACLPAVFGWSNLQAPFMLADSSLILSARFVVIRSAWSGELAPSSSFRSQSVNELLHSYYLIIRIRYTLSYMNTNEL